ncbi:hypothetical protein GEMRC1_009649 [Eukaryota sp. GEM-RC1]
MEFIHLSQWIKESGIYTLLRCLNFFKHNLIFRFFFGWLAWIKKLKFKRNLKRLSNNLLCLRPAFVKEFLILKKFIYSLQSSPIFVISENNNFTDVQDMVELVNSQRSSFLELFQNTQTEVSSTINFIQESLHKQSITGVRNQNDDDSDSDIDVFKSIAIVEAKKNQLLKRQIMKESKRDESRFHRFIILIEEMLKCTVVKRVLCDSLKFLNMLNTIESLEHRHSSKTSGIFTTVLNFNNSENHLNDLVEFSPSEDDLISKFSEIFENIDSSIISAHQPLYLAPVLSYNRNFENINLFSISELLTGNLDLKNTRIEIFSKISNCFSRAHNHALEYSKPWVEIFKYDSADKFEKFDDLVLSWDNKQIVSEFNLLLSWRQIIDEAPKKPLVYGLLSVNRKQLIDRIHKVPAKYLQLLKDSSKKAFSSRCLSVSDRIRDLTRTYSHVPSELPEFSKFLQGFNDLKSSVQPEIDSQISSIDDFFNILNKFKIGISVNETSKYSSLKSVLNLFLNMIESTQSAVDLKLPDMRSELSILTKQIDDHLLEILTEVYAPFFSQTLIDPAVVLEKLFAVTEKLNKVAGTITICNQYEDRLGKASVTDFPNLISLRKVVDSRLILWKSLDDWNNFEVDISSKSFGNLDFNKIETKLSEVSKTIHSVEKTLKTEPILPHFNDKISKFKLLLPKIKLLLDSNLKDHHWIEMFQNLEQKFSKLKSIDLNF